MAVEDVQVPPIRTNLNDPNVTDQTAKEWYLYWQNSGRRINTLNGMVTYGNSADRLDPADAADGALFVEQDRSGVIYQNQGGEWHYIAGTMYGTISPDQRPSNLGPNDAGFHFRSTDTDPLLGGHEWIWSGTDWIEVTANRYGGHANRLLQPLPQTWNGMIWVEPDRGGVIYQNQSGVWHYLAGTMFGTISPDQRPTDLGANDAGFDFRTSTSPPREFIWSGTVWVEVTATDNSALIAYGTANPTLTTTPTDMPGCSITLSKAGVWLIHGVGYFFCGGAGDANQFLQAQLSVNGVAQAGGMSLSVPAGNAGTVGQQWVYTAGSVGQIAKLQAFKSGGTGTSQIFGVNTSLSALWVSP